jgi:hypothetical protein
MLSFKELQRLYLLFCDLCNIVCGLLPQQELALQANALSFPMAEARGLPRVLLTDGTDQTARTRIPGATHHAARTLSTGDTHATARTPHMGDTAETARTHPTEDTGTTARTHPPGDTA